MDVVYGTVCSGIGCAELAAETFGWMQAFCAEIDPFACAVLKHHRSDVPNVGDMRFLADRIRSYRDAIVDVLIGGTPCQSFSVAGLRGSLGDDRGNLTLELIRILDAIDESREAVGLDGGCTLVWENVPGVLSTKDNAFGCFLGALVGADKPLPPFGSRGKWPRAGLVCGPRRSACWRIFDAQWFGVAQRRRRLFVVAGAGDGFDPAAILLEPDCLPGNPPPRRGKRQDIAGTIDASTGGCDENDAKDGRLIAFGGNNQSGPIEVATARSAHGGPHGRLDFETETFLVQTINGDSVAHALNTANNGKHCSEDGTGRGVPIIAFDSRQDCVSSIESFGSLGSSLPQSQAVAGRSTVRRLTPLECERLQGLPDHYTLLPRQLRKRIEDDYFNYLLRYHPGIDRTDAERLAKDGPRYRAIGNGMAVPVVRWILERLDLYMQGAL